MAPANKNSNAEKNNHLYMFESDYFYRAIVESAPTAIGVYIDGIVVYVNDAAVKLLKASSYRDLIGKPALDLVHPNSQADAQRDDELSRESSSIDNLSDQQYLALDGSVIDVIPRTIKITHNEINAYVVSFHDITQRKIAERKVKLSQERYRTLVENINDVIYTLDLSGKISYISPVITRFSGYEKKHHDWSSLFRFYSSR